MAGLSLTQLRKWLRKGVGNVSSDELSDDDTDELLNMSLWELENRYDFRSQQKRYTFDMTIGTYKYSLASLNSPNAMVSVALVDSDLGAYSKLDRVSRGWLDEHAVYSSDQQSKPEKYLRENNCLIFEVEPDQAYTCEFTLREGVGSLLEGTKETTGLPRNWDELVLQGAVWRGHFFNEDYGRARQAVDFQVGGIRSAVPESAEDEKDSRFARLDILWDDPSEEDDE